MRTRVWPVCVFWLLAAGLPAWAQTEAPETAADTNPVEARLRRATVFIFTDMEKANYHSRGSGVLVNRTGLVLTNNHVIDPNHNHSRAERLAIAKIGGKVSHKAILDNETINEHEYTATVVHQNEACDVALIQLTDPDGNPPKTPNFLTFVPDGSLRKGMKIKTMGFPGEKEVDRPPTLTLGLITDFVRTPGGFVSKIQTDATVIPGNSGGPVIESSGHLIGIVSLLELQEGTKNRCGVVPGHLIKQFILNGFQQGRMPEKMDILPFLDLFTDENDVFRLPGKERPAKEAVVHRADGTVRRCTLVSDHLTLPTALGSVDVPTGYLAYILMQDGTAYALFDGGDQLAFPPGDVALTVKIDNKNETIKLTDAALVCFPLPAKAVPMLPGTGTILQTAAGSQLGLAEIKGDVKVGSARCSLAAMTSIQTDENGQRTVSTAKGERLRGEVGDQPVTARTVWSSKPIQIQLAGIEQATLRPLTWAYRHARGRRLVDRMPDLEPELKEIAELLDGPDWKKAQPLIEAKAKKPSSSLEAGRQFRVLRAVAQLRSGDIAGARDAFQKFPRTEVVAQAYSRVLERYPDGMFKGVKLSEPDAFWRASTVEAKRVLDAVSKEVAESTKRLEEEPKLDLDTRMATALKKLEGELDVANQLDIGLAQPALVQVLTNQYYFQMRRFGSLAEDHEEAANALRGSQTRGSIQANLRKARSIEAQIKVLRREVERIIDRYKVEGAGFKLEAPEFQEAPEQ